MKNKTEINAKYIYDVIAQAKSITAIEISELLIVSIPTVNRRISHARRLGMIINSNRVLRYDKNADTYSVWVYSV